jgi:hypothetical protein
MILDIAKPIYPNHGKNRVSRRGTQLAFMANHPHFVPEYRRICDGY